MPENAMSEPQEREKTGQSARNATSADFSISDWSLKIREGKEDRGTLALDGEDLIIVEDIGNAQIKMKPINGDFSTIQYFTACASNWLASLKRSDGEIFDAAEIWLQFKAFKERLGISATEFLDQLLPEANTYTPGRF
jgi:hypothetical protein